MLGVWTMSLVVADGMEGLTIARLANRMNASVGAVYRYFQSKEALVVGLQELAIADFHAFMQGRLAAHEPRMAGVPADTRALARLLVAFGSYLEHAEHSPRPHRLVDTFLSFPEAVLSDVEARSIGERLIEPVLTTFVSLLAEAARAGAIDPGDDLQRTHLAWAFVHGLDHFRKRDRIMPETLQVKALLGEEWVGGIPADEPVIICGDFNALPGSAPYKLAAAKLRDVQAAREGHRPLGTFSSIQPLVRLDHIFISVHFERQWVTVVRNDLTRIASDHLPLVADLRIATATDDTSTTRPPQSAAHTPGELPAALR